MTLDVKPTGRTLKRWDYGDHGIARDLGCCDGGLFIEWECTPGMTIYVVTFDGTELLALTVYIKGM